MPVGKYDSYVIAVALATAALMKLQIVISGVKLVAPIHKGHTSKNENERAQVQTQASLQLPDRQKHVT